MKRRLMLELGAGLIFAIFGCAASAYGVYSLGRTSQPWLLAIPPAIAMVLIVLLSRLQRRIEVLPDDPVRPDIERFDARNRRSLATINLLMIVAVIAAVKLLLNAQKPEYIAPAAAVIVGVHFVALARPMEMRIQAIAGVFMCLVAAGVSLTAPAPSRAPLIGLLCGANLWIAYLIQLRVVWMGLRRRDSAF